MDIESNLRKVAVGDRGAFATLYKATQANLVGYAAGLLAGDRLAAEDAVDEAFIAIWQQAGRFVGNGHALGWMRRIVRNKAVDWLRKQRDVLMGPDEQSQSLEISDCDALSPYDLAERGSTETLVRKALGCLSIDQREAIWLCYFEDKSMREIAIATGCPENTVKTRLFHARRILRESGILDALSPPQTQYLLQS